MPIYATQCKRCGKEKDVYRAVKDYDDLEECCGEKMSRRLSAPYVVTDIQPYKSMVTGEMVTSRSQHREHLKEHRLVEIGNEKPLPAKEIKPLGGIREDLTRTFTQYGL